MNADIYAQTDRAIVQTLGRRLRAIRLHKNRTQKGLATRITVSVGTIKALEAGRGKLETVVAVLRELGAPETLDAFLPEPTVSPLQLAKNRGTPRQRASGSRDAANVKTDRRR